MDDFQKVLIAHCSEDGTVQPLQDHLQKVAELAEKFCSSFEASSWGYAAGLLHDDGKASDEFQRRIRALARGDNARRVDHSTPGALFASENIDKPQGAGKLLAYLIAGHHAGLPNGAGGADHSSLSSRLSNSKPGPGLMADHMNKLSLPPFMKENKLDPVNVGFQLAFFIRMVYSALVDADFLDTETFMDSEKSRYRSEYPTLEELYPLLKEYLKKLKEISSQNHINNLRNEILSDCIKAAKLYQGIFSLTVPTGGGKTLSSLAFAFEHALRNGMQRIIYVIPYTSIIEQTAELFRTIFGEKAVLEHHSNFVAEDTEEQETSLARKLATENWDAPIIVTTNVQFFESCFANRSSKTRKLHNIAGSVVILDEAQMLPVPFLRPTIEVIRELSNTYGTSVVLCTATQPALLENHDFKRGLSGVREMVSAPEKLESDFKRVQSIGLGEQSEEEIADFMANEEQILCIVNTRNQARSIAERLLEADKPVYHLSALMCPRHRREVLQKVKDRLKAGVPCKLVSTQLVEAGVDIDFPVVVRAITGIDSVVQAAGRCNREGKLKGLGKLYVFYPEEGLPRGFFRQNAQITELVMYDQEGDYLDSSVVHEYFKELYWIKDSSGGLDKEHIIELLNSGAPSFDLPFKSVAQLYKLIPNEQTPVIVPYDDSAYKLCEELRYNTKPGALLRKLQQYTVPLYPQQLQQLLAGGFVEKIQDEFYILSDYGVKEIYDELTGIHPSIPEFYNSGFLMV